MFGPISKEGTFRIRKIIEPKEIIKGSDIEALIKS